MVLVEPGNKLPDVKLCLDRQQYVLIVGYDEFSDRHSQLANHLRSRRFDVLILDEAHYLKNPQQPHLGDLRARAPAPGSRPAPAR